MLALDHVSKKVLADIQGKVRPKEYSEAMSAWYAYKSGTGQSLSKAQNIAFGIHESQRQTEILEALLLSNCPTETICEAFEVPPESIAIYAELFFDQGVFLTRLDRLEYLEDYPDPWGRDLKLRAVNLGYEYVLFTFANLVPKTQAQKKLVERMFMATAYKAMAMNYNGIKSDANKQAIRHAELMIRAYELLAKSNAEENADNHDLQSLLAAEALPDPEGKGLPRPEEVI